MPIGALFDKIDIPKYDMHVYIYIIIGAIFVIGMLLFIYLKPKANYITVEGPFVLKGTEGNYTSSYETIFDQAQLTQDLGNNFTLGFFVYMDRINAEKIPFAGPMGDFRFKPLLKILGVGEITLDPIHQMMRVSVEPQTTPNNRDLITHIDIDNFLIARWNQIVISVEGRTVDIYINGVIAKSALMENVPMLYPIGLLLETVPDFSGQAGLFQAWPRRLTESEITRNYSRNTDTVGKPLISDKGSSFKEIFNIFTEQLCNIGLCGYGVVSNSATGPLQYIDYEYA